MSKARATTKQIEEHGKSWQSKIRLDDFLLQDSELSFPIFLAGNQLSALNCTKALCVAEEMASVRVWSKQRVQKFYDTRCNILTTCKKALDRQQ